MSQIKTYEAFLSTADRTDTHRNYYYWILIISRLVLQCNELNRGHSTFFYQSQDEFRTKESELVPFGPITNEGQIWLGIEVLFFSCSVLVLCWNKNVGWPRLHCKIVQIFCTNDKETMMLELIFMIENFIFKLGCWNSEKGVKMRSKQQAYTPVVKSTWNQAISRSRK